MLESISMALLVTASLVVAFCVFYGVALDGFAYVRPFGVSEAESLMNFSPLGQLQCQCIPTDAAEPRTDRRCSCRACGNAIITHDTIRLYQPISSHEIRRMTRNLRNASIDARKVHLPATLTNLATLHAVADLASLGE